MLGHAPKQRKSVREVLRGLADRVRASRAVAYAINFKDCIVRRIPK